MRDQTCGFRVRVGGHSFDALKRELVGADWLHHGVLPLPEVSEDVGLGCGGAYCTDLHGFVHFGIFRIAGYNYGPALLWT